MTLISFEGPWLIVGVPFMLATIALWLWALVDAAKVQRAGWVVAIAIFHFPAAIAWLFVRSGTDAGPTAAARLRRDLGKSPQGPWG